MHFKVKKTVERQSEKIVTIIQELIVKHFVDYKAQTLEKRKLL